MTVIELITYLEKLPKDAVIGVVFMACSELTVLEESDLKLHTKDDVPKGRHKRQRFVFRHGKLMEYDPKVWDTAETPVFVSVLEFPGN